MDSYNLIRQAILDKRSLTATYQGRVRHFSPHAIGRSDEGSRNLMAYQYDGGSSGPLPEWRCFHISELRDVTTNNDAWHTASDHSRMNTCVTHVDVQAR
jgi:hypothetical protein